MKGPSAARGVQSRNPADLVCTDLLSLEESNGFTIFEFDREHDEFQLFRAPTEGSKPERLKVEIATRFNVA
jgi:hypothetical protein